jgi:hypothetical protein
MPLSKAEESSVLIGYEIEWFCTQPGYCEEVFQVRLSGVKPAIQSVAC